MKKPPANYDYTAAKRSASRRARTAKTLSLTIDALHVAAIEWLMEDTGETTSALVRRLLLDEAERRGAPVPPRD